MLTKNGDAISFWATESMAGRAIHSHFVSLKAAPYKIDLGTQSVPVGFVRNRKARRYILRMLPGGLARVTIPRGGTLEYAAEFARKNSAWIEQHLRRTPPAWQDGTEILFRGVPTAVRVIQDEHGLRGSFAGMELAIRSMDELRAAVEARLRVLATEELTPRTWEFAGALGLEVSAVSVRDQRSRWGSCSMRKRICLNWRLIQTPEFVRDYIIIHELMHLKEMNHSPKYWAHVEAACPTYMEAERWLRKNSRLLR
jgi:predicted metal-dependent hydrolase